ncbi:YtpR family tRNA-binding protein [Oceanobacillus sp. FSL K6-2867]|uniref:YtpR family tRNA-binding protein n=1 Tax=Oceanobacillus sp. FSL K6-2867 TaxID=2954748 RepID=UPI0030DA7A5A
MDVFYNPDGIGDVLLIPIKEGDRYEIEHQSFGPVTKITSKESEVLGYNIFEASKHLDLTETGKIKLTESFLEEIKQLFVKNQLNDQLDFDLSPKFVVGYVTSKNSHENADKLSVCQVDVGNETLQIVCGAPNVDTGQKVVVAKVGATMPSGLKIKPSELRGVPSHGMICSQKELGLPNAPAEKGIYVLDDSYTIGEEFKF